MSFLSGFPAVLKVALPLAVGAALAGAIAWGANGGGAGGGGAPGAPAASAPTPKPEKTPGPPWDPARPDCPPGWQVYNDPDGYFSICYPQNLFTATGEGIPGGGRGFVVRNYPAYDPQKPLPTPAPSTFRVTVYWRPAIPLQTNSNDPCDIDRVVSHLPVASVPTEIAGKTVTLCQASGENEDSGVEPLSTWIPDAQHGGVVELSSARGGPIAVQSKGLVAQIIDTLRVP